ncbi:MAG: murein transglycosylase A [Alphaproteobacteria bacterium]|nr:murein transglycosylase A [Alphaproteobacteria bacterium]MBU0798919.1 murein transglycosylase A [Alphaproteobacteria bacterium]MBU0886307.1 murein transglycosylase A [Alphaproteobacteria bacterium]MBU1813497.1 murein transglycosylase A [Alphaproteobacteria bacterium]
MNRFIFWNLLAGFALLVAACEQAKPPAPPAEALILTPARYADMPGWSADDASAALPALLKSCGRLKPQPADRAFGPDARFGKIADWLPACAAAEKLPAANPAAARAFFEANFQPYRAANNAEAKGLFTGYYEAELSGSLTRTARHTVPLHRRPDDLVMVDLGQFREELKGQRIAGRVIDGSLKPYESRQQIVGGALDSRRLEILWVDDPVDAFFLQIQGSGRVTLADGRVIRVGYAGQNGHPYVAIGRELIAKGELTRENVSMQSIRAWLAANPGRADEIMNSNPSYVFFRELPGEGPVGAQGVALTPLRSLAVDRRFVPLGTPVWLDVDHPDSGAPRLRQLVVAQDVGGAIRGPVRGDLFWGHGKDAADKAGRMKSTGFYYLLLPKALTPGS